MNKNGLYTKTTPQYQLIFKDIKISDTDTHIPLFSSRISFQIRRYPFFPKIHDRFRSPHKRRFKNRSPPKQEIRSPLEYNSDHDGQTAGTIRFRSEKRTRNETKTGQIPPARKIPRKSPCVLIFYRTFAPFTKVCIRTRFNFNRRIKNEEQIHRFD